MPRFYYPSLFGIAAISLLLDASLLAINAGAVEQKKSAAPAQYLHANEPIGTVRQIYDGALSPELAVNTFRNIDRLFPVNKIKAASAKQVMNLPLADVKLRQQLAALEWKERGQVMNLTRFFDLNRIAGALVLKDGKIVLENYRYGNTEQTRWMSMSVAKSITSTLVGAALKQGKIKSLRDPVSVYVPELKASGYQDASVRDVLMMASGVAWSETYSDPNSDRRRLLEAQISQKPGAALEVMRKLPRVAEPGTLANYNTGETQVVAQVLRNAVGVSLAEYLSDRIWSRFGMEADAYWWLDSPNGVEIGGSGISATLRDYGRFALFMLNQGRIKNEPILPDGWTYEATTPTLLKNGKPLAYGYLWWPAVDLSGQRDAAYSAIGIHGQAMYINPSSKLVIVLWGAQVRPTGGAGSDNVSFYQAVNSVLR